LGGAGSGTGSADVCGRHHHPAASSDAADAEGGGASKSAAPKAINAMAMRLLMPCLIG
jgi:hypothetical protein